MSQPIVSNKVLQEIIEKSNSSNGMYIQEIYKDMLRSLLNIFGNIYYLDKNNNSIKIKCYHANQERAIAKAVVGDNITLPVITIGETSTNNDDDRRRYSPILVHEKGWDKDKQRAVRLLSLAPRAVNITYDINIWCKYKQDLDQIRESIFLLFNPDLEVGIKSNTATKLFITSESDTSEVTASDTQDRILRKSIKLNGETYIPNPKFLYTSTGKIENFNFEVEINTSRETVTTAQTTTTTNTTVTEQVPTTLTTEGLFGFYRFSNPDVVSPDSTKFLATNAQSSDNNAQIVGDI